MEKDGMRCEWEWVEEDANGNGWNELGCNFFGIALVLLVFYLGVRV